MSPALELDCRGQVCPMPVIELARRIPEIEVGEVVAVLADVLLLAHAAPRGYVVTRGGVVGEDAADDGVPRYLVRRVS